ncbi:MAG TPA: hypothetical protein VFV54_10510, partial [Thermoanaerobaculia bacterium]|nr:hypothetical protein [Thermoanaerobaculia bacterium]
MARSTAARPMTEAAGAPRAARTRMLLAAGLLLHLLPFAVRPALIGGDEPHYALIAHSIATDFDLTLRDEYEEVESGSSAAGRKRRGERLERHVRTVGGAEVPSHPVGLPLLLAPVAALQQTIAPGSPPDIAFGLVALLVTFAALVAGARLLATRAGSPRDGALLLFGIYFASPLWFYSRTIFTEPFTWAFGVLSVAAIAAGSFGFASLFLGLALAMKETALLLVAPIIVAAGIHSGWKKGAVLAIGPLAWGAAFVAKNVLTVGAPLSTFQTFQMGDVVAGAAGLIADPARGLLWFAPLLLLSVAGWLVPARDREDRIAGWASAAIVLGYFLVTAAWVDWRGGSSWGPRLLIPALPALAVPLLRLWIARTGTPWRAALAAAALAGFVVNWCAALDPFTAFWGPPAWELVGKNAVAAIGGA